MKFSYAIPSFIVLLTLCLACGSADVTVESADQQEPAADVSETGTDGGMPAEPDTAASTAQLDVPAEPVATTGTLLVKLLAGKKEGEGTFTVSTAEVDAKVIAENVPGGQVVELEPGDYDVKAVFTTAIDHPVAELRDVTIAAGEQTDREIKFPVGEITLLAHRGRSALKAKVKIRKQMEGMDTGIKKNVEPEPWFETMANTHEPFLISAGKYECEVQLSRKKGYLVKGITVYEGGVHKIPINVR